MLTYPLYPDGLMFGSWDMRHDTLGLGTRYVGTLRHDTLEHETRYVWTWDTETQYVGTLRHDTSGHSDTIRWDTETRYYREEKRGRKKSWVKIFSNLYLYISG